MALAFRLSRASAIVDVLSRSCARHKSRSRAPRPATPRPRPKDLQVLMSWPVVQGAFGSDFIRTGHPASYPKRAVALISPDAALPKQVRLLHRPPEET